MQTSYTFRRALDCIPIILAIAATHSRAQAEFLNGQTISVIYTHITNIGDVETGVDPGPVLVGPGVELPNFGKRENPPLPALVDIDISDRSILFTLLIDQPQSIKDRFQFTDVLHTLPPITRVTINPTTNWAGFNTARIVFAADVLFVEVGDLPGVAGQKILLDVIPEPSTACLAFAGVTVLVRRRR